jgi:hypothetical protein
MRNESSEPEIGYFNVKLSLFNLIDEDVIKLDVSMCHTLLMYKV